MTSPPSWAQDLVINTLIAFKPDAEIPKLKWRKCTRESTSGKCGEYLTINAGHRHRDAKLVLLHELAHWLLPRVRKTYGRGEWAKELVVPQGHTPEFWDLAWTLYKWAGLPVSYCKSREYGYKVGARKGYLRSRNKKEEA